MGTQRKEKPKQERLLSPDDKVLGQARRESDGTDSSHTWGEKIEKKAKEKNYSYLKGWLRVRLKNDEKLIKEYLNEIKEKN